MQQLPKIPKEMFETAGIDHAQAEKIEKPSLSFWQDVFIRFRKNKLAMFGVVLMVLLVLWLYLVH